MGVIGTMNMKASGNISPDYPVSQR